jgi:hypothetical protein
MRQLFEAIARAMRGRREPHVRRATFVPVRDRVLSRGLR